MERSDIKRAIEKLEYYERGLHMSSCGRVKVTNLKVRRTKPIQADVTFFTGEGERVSTLRGVEYVFDALCPSPTKRGNC